MIITSKKFYRDTIDFRVPPDFRGWGKPQGRERFFLQVLKKLGQTSEKIDRQMAGPSFVEKASKS